MNKQEQLDLVARNYNEVKEEERYRIPVKGEREQLGYGVFGNRNEGECGK